MEGAEAPGPPNVTAVLPGMAAQQPTAANVVGLQSVQLTSTPSISAAHAQPEASLSTIPAAASVLAAASQQGPQSRLVVPSAAVAVPGAVPAAPLAAAVVPAAVVAPSAASVLQAGVAVPTLLPPTLPGAMPAAPTIVPPTPAALALLAAANEAASTANSAVIPVAAVPAPPSLVGSTAVGMGDLPAAYEEAAAAAPESAAAAAAAAADAAMPDAADVLPPTDSNLATSPIGSAAADAMAAAVAASRAAQQQQQQQQQQEQQVQLQQFAAQQQQLNQQVAQQNQQQQQLNLQIAQHQHHQQQQQAMLSLSPPSSAAGSATSAALTAELTAAGFPAAAAAFAAQQQQQQQQMVQQQQQQMVQQQQQQQQQQLMAAAGLSTATALVPTGATPAQIAAGMPAVQAVSVLVPANQGTTGQVLGQTLGSQVTGPGSTMSTTSTLGGASVRTAAVLNQALGAAGSTAGLLSVGSPGSFNLGSDTASASSQLSAALTNLAIAQHQQQQQQQQQQAAATAALLQAAASSASSAMLPSVSSNMSLSNMRSTSASSSVMSGMPPAKLDPIPSSAPSSGSMTGAKVRVLLSSGGEYEEVTSSEGSSGGRSTRWRYVGGETRLVGLKRTNHYGAFLQQLSKSTSAVWDESCRLMYELPSEGEAGGMLIDLIDDEDLDSMWEELDVILATKPTFRLHIYVQLGSKRVSTGPGDGSIQSEENVSEPTSGSTPKEAAVAAATAAAAAAGSGSADSTGTAKGAAGTSAGSEPAVLTDRAKASEPAGPSGAAGVTGSHGTGVTFTSSELDGLVDDIVTDGSKQALHLSELEAKLDIISPDDLTPVRLLGSGGFGEVYLCRWHSCDVAVKCLNPNLLVPDGAMGSISKENVSELLKEANLLGSVRHPNIVWVYGLVLPPLDAAVEAVRQGLAPGQGIDAVKVTMQMANKHRADLPMSALRPPALVTEYLASGSLRAAITRKADFLTKDSVKIKLALDAARGMEYLHGKNIVHFDLKTANLLVGMRDKTPIAKVADFGLSKRKQQTYVTGVATLRGTLPWIAPEIIKTPSSVTEAVDVYSYGIVLWELWTLKEPFEGINYHALLHMMSTSSEAVRPPLPGAADFEGEASPEPYPGWGDIIKECWEVEPEKRPTFKQLVGRLETMLRQNRMAKKRSASGPAGTGCATSTPVSQG